MESVLFSGFTGSIQPEVDVTTVTVLDWDTPIGIKITTSRLDDKLTLVRRNVTDTGWESVADENGIAELSYKRNTVVVSMPGVYGLQGYVRGQVTASKIEVE